LQAQESEEDARKMIASLDVCYQCACLKLVHHVFRTNIKTLVDEISAFLRDRFVENEVVDMTLTTSSGAK
jgi:predicted lipid carrier protein YhbT